MPVLPLRQIGDPVLRTPATSVNDPRDTRIIRLVEDMYLTMEDARGIGLAAPQIGVGLRVFTWDVEGNRGAVINPEIQLSGNPEFIPRESDDDGEQVLREGCLSVPGRIYGPVSRHPHTVLTGTDEYGQPLSLDATGLLSACFQHEVDHLDGKLFLDRLAGEHKKQAYRELRRSDVSSLPPTASRR